MTEWILPYNEMDEEAYRVNDALRNLGKIEWVQNKNLKNINVGDTVYLYNAAPVKAIRWKCRVTDVQREDSIIDDSAYSGSRVTYEGPFIELEPLYEYFLLEELSLSNLKKNGYVGNMQGSFRLERCKPELSEYIHKIDKVQVSAYAKKRAGQCCELCGETIDNTVALCPNCHRKMHIAPEQKDILYLQKMLKNNS